VCVCVCVSVSVSVCLCVCCVLLFLVCPFLEMSFSPSVTLSAPSSLPYSAPSAAVAYAYPSADHQYAAQTQYTPLAATIQTPQWYDNNNNNYNNNYNNNNNNNNHTVQTAHYESSPYTQTTTASHPSLEAHTVAPYSSFPPVFTADDSSLHSNAHISAPSSYHHHHHHAAAASAATARSLHPAVASHSFSMRVPHSRTVFYNTHEGAKIIASARAALSNRSKPLDLSTHKSATQENRQRAFHQDCFVSKTARDYTQPVQTQFRHYPMEEYHRFDAEKRKVVGPNPHVATR